MLLDIQKLTAENIAEIKYAKRFGYIFGSLAFLFGLPFNFYFMSELNISYKWLIIYNVSITLTSFLIIFLVNRKYNNDLLYNEKIIKKDILKNKRTEVNPKVVGKINLGPYLRSVEQTTRYYFIIGNIEYYVEKKIYNRFGIGEEVELHYALCSKMLLEIKKSC